MRHRRVLLPANRIQLQLFQYNKDQSVCDKIKCAYKAERSNSLHPETGVSHHQV